MKTFVCVCQSTDYSHVDEHASQCIKVFLSFPVKCFTHNRDLYAEIKLFETVLGRCLHNGEEEGAWTYTYLCTYLSYTLSLNLYSLSQWCNRKCCLQLYIGNLTERWTQKLNTTTCLFAVLLINFVLQVASLFCHMQQFNSVSFQWRYYSAGLIISKTRSISQPWHFVQTK